MYYTLDKEYFKSLFHILEIRKNAEYNYLTATEHNGTPLRYSCLENPMDRGAWWAAVHGVTKTQTQLSDFTFTFHFHALKKEMATYSSVLACRIPGMGEPGGLPSMGLHRVGHDWSDLAASIILKYMEVIKELKTKIIIHPGIIGILYFLLLSNVHKG